MSTAIQEDGIAEFAEDLAAKADEFARSVSGSGPAPVAAESGRTFAGPGLAAVLRLPVEVKVVLGTATMQVSALGRLVPGAIVSLDRKVGEPVDLVVNGQVVARGEIVVTNEGGARFAISILEVGDGRARNR